MPARKRRERQRKMPETFTHLFTPLRVGAKETRNRLLITAHVPGLAENGVPGDRYIAYHRARARGGAGLQITGCTGIHATGALDAARGLANLDERIVGGYRNLARAVHAEGGLILAQLGHSAATVDNADAGLPLWAPSPIASELVKQVPHEMTAAEIGEIVGAYGAAALRVRDGDMDGVEILGAFGFLVAAFLSPLTNQRTDDYGGSLDNRLRFAREVCASVRASAGHDLIVGMRIPGDERVPGGLSGEDMQEISQRLAATGHLDYLNVIAGTNMSRLQRVEHWGPTPAPHGLFVDLAAAIKQAVDIPVFTTGRITEPELAEQILREGQADMVGMTRAHIADPDIARKIAAGRRDDIRPCVGANVCISRAVAGKPVRCFYNPDTAREHDWGAAQPAASPKRVAVIGGGPAGLEAARVAAERGHQVSLYEAHETLGGQLSLWAKTPLVGEFRKSVAWYEAQLRTLQVRVHTSSPMSDAEMQGLDVDDIIVATGSRPSPLPDIYGQEGSSIRCINPYEAIDRPPSDAAHVLLVDEGGQRAGLAAAELLCEQIPRLTIATGDAAVAHAIDAMVQTPIYKHLLRHNVQFAPNVCLERFDGSTAIFRNIYSKAEHPIENVDVAVLWLGNQVVDGLARVEARPGVRVHFVGDCVAPRSVVMATSEGAMAARGI